MAFNYVWNTRNNSTLIIYWFSVIFQCILFFSLKISIYSHITRCIFVFVTQFITQNSMNHTIIAMACAQSVRGAVATEVFIVKAPDQCFVFYAQHVLSTPTPASHMLPSHSVCNFFSLRPRFQTRKSCNFPSIDKNPVAIYIKIRLIYRTSHHTYLNFHVCTSSGCVRNYIRMCDARVARARV